MNFLLKTAQLFTLLSISTIFIKKWTLVGTPLKITDLFLIVSLILTIILILTKKILIKHDVLKSIMGIGVLFLVLFVGTLSSFIIFKNLPLKEIFISYSRIIACSIIFVQILIFNDKNSNFIRYTILSFIPSFIVIPITYLFPQLISSGLLLDSSQGRFAGLFNDPNYYSNFTILPTLTILYLFSNENRIFFKALFFVIFSFSIGFLIWTGSRSGWIGIIVALILFIFFEFKSKGAKKMITTLIVITIASIIGLFIVPQVAQKQITERSQIFITKNEININTSNNISTNTLSLTNGQDRVSLWKQSFNYMKRSPLGYGPNYNNVINIENYGSHRAIHNIILESLLIGGIPLIIFYIFMFKNIQIFKNKNYFLTAAFLGTLTSSFFIDSFESRWLWIIIAVIIATSYSTVNIFNKND